MQLLWLLLCMQLSTLSFQRVSPLTLYSLSLSSHQMNMNPPPPPLNPNTHPNVQIPLLAAVAAACSLPLKKGWSFIIRMDYPSEEWEIQEYSPSEGSKSTVSWIVGKGLDLGRKIVITGVVISSAPFVLPTLMVISALGFAFSVPFGLVFASYACTEKLMSKLLPSPKSPLMLENGTLSDEEIEEVGFGDIMEIEEDAKDWAEMESELVDDEYWQNGDEKDDLEPVQEVDDEIVKDWGYEEDAGNCLDVTVDEYGHKSTEKGREVEPRKHKNEKMKEEGYEEDVDEDLKGVDERPLEGIDVKIEGIGEEEKGKEEPVVDRSKRERPLDEVHHVKVAVEKDENNGDVVTKEVAERGPEREDKVSTTGLLKKRRGEGDVGSPVEKDKNEKNITIAEEMEKPFEVKCLKLDRLTEKIKGKEGKRRNKGPKKNKKIQERKIEENVDAVSGEVKQVVEMGGMVEGSRDEMKFDSDVVVEKPTGDRNGSTNGNRVGKVAETIEEEMPMANKEAATQSTGNKNETVSGGNEAFQMEPKSNNDVHSNVDAREIAGESGFDSSSDRNEAGDKNSYTVSENPQEYEDMSDHAPDGNAVYLELHVSAEEVPVLKGAGIDSEIVTALPASEVPLSEVKIWEQIEALRMIVGYKAAPHATCVEELKALYIFTGVEPPAASFKKTTDLVDVNDKLQFLMSIVGVK